MKKGYIFDYLNENDFRLKERSLRKYNMLAYKKLVFQYYPELKNGNFLGKVIEENKNESSVSYELELPTDDLFKKVHGVIRLHYTIFSKNNTILLTNITPEDIFEEGHRIELSTYKGVMVSKSNAKRDMFKIELMNMLHK